LSQCQNKEVAKALSSLELKANLFDDTESELVIDGDRQEEVLRGREDELRKRVRLALEYIDSI
jgi:hydroxypyruvate isomerase